MSSATIDNTPLSSITASVSLVFALMSVLLIFTGWAPVVTSLLAILFAFYARSAVKSSEGRLTGGGKAGFALFLGILFFVLSIVMLFGMRMQVAAAKGWWASVDLPLATLPPLPHAEKQLLSSSNASETGNSIQATGLADTLKSELQLNHNEYFVGHKKQINVYCQNSENGCCFLIYAPEVGSYDQAARDALCHLAWDSAQKSAMSLLDPGTEMAVAIRDVYRYRNIQLGTVPENGVKTDPGFTTIDETLLEQFFIDRNQYEEGTEAQ